MRKGFLVTLVLMLCSCALAAQVPATAPAKRMDITTTAMHWDVTHPAIAGELALSSVHVQEQRPSAIDSMYEYTETPFIQHVDVPVASFVGGHVRLAGFQSYMSTENFHLGLPGGGTLPSFGVTMQSHPAVLAPAADQSAGFNLTFHLHGTEPGFVHCRALHAAGRALGIIRGS